jgi:hypothetical protein
MEEEFGKDAVCRQVYSTDTMNTLPLEGFRQLNYEAN